MSFIDSFIKTFDQAESPESFFRWSAIAAISAILKKNVYIQKGIYKLYPNLYIMLVAKSGLRKGFPVKQAQKLVEELESIKVISGRSSIQSIISELSKSWTLESGRILKNAQAFVVNDELDSLLIGDPQAQTILTTLYDSFYHKHWKNTLKKDGQELLQDLYITMLTATNPEHLERFLDKSSVKGGFLGRTCMVYEERKSKINPLIGEGVLEVDTKPLLNSLFLLSELKGVIGFEKKAEKSYIDWYTEFHTKLDRGEMEDETGTAERSGDIVLKLAMIHAIDKGSLIVTCREIEAGKLLFYEAANSTKRILAGSGKSEISDKVRTVLGYLLSRPECAAYRKQVLAAKYGDIDSIDLGKVIDTLEQAGIIEVLIDRTEGPLYKITNKYIQKLREKNGG